MTVSKNNYEARKAKYDSEQEALDAFAKRQRKYLERKVEKAKEEDIGKVVHVPFSGFVVYCEIVDARTNQSTLEYKIRPLAGEGSAWLLETRMVLERRDTRNR